MDNTYTITDLKELSNTIRKHAADSLAEHASKSTNLDDYITLEQISDIIVSNSCGQDEDGCYIIDEDIFESIFDDVAEIIYGVGMAKLASDNLVECAWDDKKNRMIFWVPEYE
jgi:hypothetical protein|tara:strand:- start:492 stop:830 length:339 start_codon:yes stop_codon:yes gene_type:complete